MKKSITRDEWSSLIVLLAVALGAFIRFNPTLLAGFALNDGGMFAVMVDDLRANHYLIPAFTTYNQLGIPFAYPPLGFYFGALAANLFNMDAAQVVRWVPVFFASLSVPAFYLLALRLLKNKYSASVSTIIFALMPRAFFWSVMGGGLTRSTGQFFMLLALTFTLRLYEENHRADIFWVGLLGGLAVMSHPEAATHTAISAVFFWLMLSRKRQTFIHSILVGFIVLIVSAPWWITVMRQHGLEPLRNAMQTGGNSLAIFHLLFFAFTEEPFATFISVLGLIGIAHRLIRREYLLPLWMVLPFILEGRSAVNLAAGPLAMLAAIGLVDVVFAALQSSAGNEAKQSVQVSSVERNLFIYLLLYLLFSAYQFGYQFSNTALSLFDRQAMEWTRQNTAQDSRFVVLSGSTSVACDATSEWFPALADRASIFTVQGREWTLGKDFGTFIREAGRVQACVNSGMACLDEQIGPGDYDYLYVSRHLRVNNCALLELGRDFSFFVEGVNHDARFESVFENDEVVIYKLR